MIYAESSDDWSRQVAARYQGRCAWPGCIDSFGLGAHHIVPRGLEALALIVENGVFLCQRHHDIVERKKGQTSYMKIMTLLIGPYRWAMLQEEKAHVVEMITQPRNTGEGLGKEASRIETSLL